MDLQGVFDVIWARAELGREPFQWPPAPPTGKWRPEGFIGAITPKGWSLPRGVQPEALAKLLIGTGAVSWTVPVDDLVQLDWIYRQVYAAEWRYHLRYFALARGLVVPS